MNPHITIESGIPIPPWTEHVRIDYSELFARMQVGDSFCVSKGRKQTIKIVAKRIGAKIQIGGETNTPLLIRVWLVERFVPIPKTINSLPLPTPI